MVYLETLVFARLDTSVVSVFLNEQLTHLLVPLDSQVVTRFRWDKGNPNTMICWERLPLKHDLGLPIHQSVCGGVCTCETHFLI